jgi:hypothetical protein
MEAAQNQVQIQNSQVGASVLIQNPEVQAPAVAVQAPEAPARVEIQNTEVQAPAVPVDTPEAPAGAEIQVPAPVTESPEEPSDLKLHALYQTIRSSLLTMRKHMKVARQTIADALLATFGSYTELHAYRKEVKLVFARSILEKDEYELYRTQHWHIDQPDKNTERCKLQRAVNDTFRPILDLAYGTEPYEAVKRMLRAFLGTLSKGTAVPAQIIAAVAYAKAQKWKIQRVSAPMHLIVIQLHVVHAILLLS